MKLLFVIIAVLIWICASAIGAYIGGRYVYPTVYLLAPTGHDDNAIYFEVPKDMK